MKISATRISLWTLALVVILIVSFPMTSICETQTEEPIPTLTIENNRDLKALLALKDPFDDSVVAFAEKYQGQIIEFDGNIAYMSNHGNYQTRYDILISAGDYSETAMFGPSFQFKDVGMFDLNLIGDVPDSIGMGNNLHIVATVGEYNETQGLFFLDPISIEVKK